MRNLLIILFTCFLFGGIQAQISQKIGDWESFLPYKDGKHVTQSSEKVYYSTGLSVFSIDKEDVDDWRFMSKVEGLSDIGVQSIKYDKFNEQLLIAYENSNIDIIKDGEIINISNIKDNQVLTGSRTINDIHIPNQSSVFLATDFGIVELSLENLEFGSTIFTNIPVADITSIGSQVYAATADGIYYVDIESNPNIADFSSWELLGDAEQLPAVYDATHIESFGEELFINIDNELYYGVTGSPFEVLVLEDFEDFDIQYIAPGVNRIIVGLTKSSIGRALFIDESKNIKVGGAGCISITLDAVEDEQGRIWYAEGFSEIRYTESDVSGCNKVVANSVNTESATDLESDNGVLYVAAGGLRENYSPKADRNGFYIYDNGIWTNYTKKNIPELNDIDFLNNFQIELHPDDDRIYVGSYFKGLLEYNPTDGTATVFNPDNSDLQPTDGDSSTERVSGLAFDNKGTLWVNNYDAEKPLLAYTKDEVWHSFDPDGPNAIAKVVVDRNGYTWSVVTGASGGVIVYDDKGTIADPNDDDSRFINSSNSEISTGTVNTVAVDLDGEVWVGTGQGPVIFDSGPSIFEDDNRGSKRKVLQDSIAAFLLETEDIRAIGIDGANRKWFGTRNGIFVQSPDGETLELQFNTDNSPLFSNTIEEFEFDDDSGVMYISTQKGLQSFRTQTLGSKSTHDRTVYAFPNPVRPDYQGPIAIKGLARDANVKITDLNGKLVYETQSLGGQAIWDGNDYNGRRAATGVYFVFSTGAASFDTPDSFVTKIMIVN